MISIITPVWKRPTVTSLVLGSWPREGFRVVVVGSPGDENRHRYNMPFDYYVEAPNSPLGAKFNAGIEAAAQIGDPIVIMGSDQIAAPHFWDALTMFASIGLSVGFTDTWMADSRTAVYWGGYDGERTGDLVGPGRMALARDYKDLLYQPDLDRNLDPTASFKPDIVLSGHGFGFCSLKTKDNLTSMNNFRRDMQMPTSQFLDIYHPALKGVEDFLL